MLLTCESIARSNIKDDHHCTLNEKQYERAKTALLAT